MKKMISLIRACMTQNMSLFVIKQKRDSKISKTILPVFLACLILFYNWSFSNMFMEEFKKTNSEYMVLTIYIMITFILTLIEGVYKASGLLFDCKDDNLLLSLPIKRSTVLFIRIFKFYVFELLYNTLFLLPAIIVYACNVNVGIPFYISSLAALLLLPIVPIIISCIIGGIISFSSSKFKSKNIVQILLTTILIIGVMFVSFNMQNVMANIAENAGSINEVITKVYYPI